MAPASVFDKAHRQLSCHAGASIIVIDAREISPMQYKCLAMCSRCRRQVYIPISREEYRKMDNREIWQK